MAPFLLQIFDIRRTIPESAGGTICPDEIPRRSHRGDFAGYLNIANIHALEQEKQKARKILPNLLKRQPQHKLALQELEMLK